MFVFKNKLKKIIPIFLTFFSISFLIGFICLGITNNASIIYTTLLCIPFFMGSSFTSILLDKITNKKEHYSKKKTVIAKLMFVQILANVLNVLPFIIVVLVVFLTQNSANITDISNHPMFNVWDVVVLTLLVYITNILVIVIDSVKEQKEKKAKQA